MKLGQALRLRNKARIKLREGCVLIGVPDPTGVLEEDEIFVQIELNYLKNEESQIFDSQGSVNKHMSQRIKRI